MLNMDHYMFICIIGFCLPFLCLVKFVCWLYTYQQAEIRVDDDFDAIWTFREEQRRKRNRTVVTARGEVRAKPRFKDIFCGCKMPLEVDIEEMSEDSVDFVILPDLSNIDTTQNNLRYAIPMSRPSNRTTVECMMTTV